jgi:hypothetical protein
MKKLALAVAFSLAGLSAVVPQTASAATGFAAASFFVNIKLHPRCQISSTGASWGGSSDELKSSITTGPTTVNDTAEDTPTNNYSLTIANLAMRYTSFQNNYSYGATNFYVRCTNQLPYDVYLDTTGADLAATGAGATGTDTVLGLDYDLYIDKVANAPALPFPAQGATVTYAGNGNTAGEQFAVWGQMIPGQVGTCAATYTTGCTNDDAAANKRFITVAF